MTATRYTKILDAALVPFISTTYPDHHRFYQDNDHKHTSCWAQWYFANRNINWFTSPPESPDLDPTENAWGTMKQAIRNEYKPRTLPQLEEAIKRHGNSIVITTQATQVICVMYCTYIQIDIHTYMYIHVHTYRHTYIHTYIHT